MRAAAAEIAVERLGDLAPRRRGIAVEQRLRGDEDAREAVAALAGLLVDERLLQRMRLLGRAEPFDRRDRLAGDAPQRPGTGLAGFAVDQKRVPNSERWLRRTSRSGVSSSAVT